MATATSEKKQTKKTTAAETKVNETVNRESNAVKNEPPRAKDIDMNQYITVLNGFQGRLVFICPRTGEKYTWDNFGDEQEIELRDLRSAKSSSKTFFEKNWFMFRDEDRWVIDYLGVGAYYKNALSVNNFDDLFEKSAEDIKNIVGKLSEGQKRSVSYRARQLISEGEIDSKKAITALEESLGERLIEH